MSKTAKELIKIIEYNNLQDSIFYYEDYTEEINKFLGEFEIADNVCNSDELYIVIHLLEHDVYLRLTGEYDSYGGGDHYFHDGVKEVKPKTVQKIIYENI